MSNKEHIHEWKDTSGIYMGNPMLRRQECVCGETRYREELSDSNNYVKQSREEFIQYVLKTKELEWKKEKAELLKEIANLRKQITRLEDELID